MSVHLGGGWNLVSMTDRVVELRKEDAVYRRFTDRDGYVKVRSEPGMDRNALIEKAVAMAKRNDESLSQRVMKQLLPRHLGTYQMQQQRLAPAFTTPEEGKVYRP